MFAFLRFPVRHLKLKEKMFSEKQNTENEKKEHRFSNTDIQNKKK